MRPTTPSTDRRRRRQRGQALVLNAMTILILIGLIGLAIDGGRLYWERRSLQNAVDAAALAASDYYQDSQSVTQAINLAGREYEANERIYGTRTVNSLGGNNYSVTWTGTTETLNVTFSSSGNIAAFDVSAVHIVNLAFMLALGAGATAKVSASAEGHAKTGGTSTAAVVVLGQGGCPSGTAALQVAGNGGLQVNGGDIHVNGAVTASGGGAGITAGTFEDNCTCPVPAAVTASKGTSCGVATLADPGFTPGNTSWYSTAQASTTNTELQPGTYAWDPSGNCRFLAPGIYTMNAGVNLSGGILSNVLRPPDEAAWNTVSSLPNYDNAVASPQFWGSCAGSFTAAALAVGLNPVSSGSYGIMVTSTRVDNYPPTGVAGSTAYLRESVPSTCHPVTISAGNAIKVVINNVPGAQGYNVYASYVSSGDPCASGPWGYITHVNNTALPIVGALGSVTATIDATAMTTAPAAASVTAACNGGGASNPATYLYLCAAPTGQYGSANPPGSGGETAPSASGVYPSGPKPDSFAAGGGDKANAVDCMPRAAASAAPCTQSTVTPGAVQWYFPATQCLSISGGGTLATFSGLQYNFIGIYAPTANTCTVSVSGNGGLRMTGAVYWPGGNWSISGNGLTPVADQLIVNSLNISGNGATKVVFDPYGSPVQGFSQLSL